MYIFHILYVIHSMKPIVFFKKNEFILSRVEEILVNWVYTPLCWWRWFKNFLSWGRPQHWSREWKLSIVLSWWRSSQSWHVLRRSFLLKNRKCENESNAPLTAMQWWHLQTSEMLSTEIRFCVVERQTRTIFASIVTSWAGSKTTPYYTWFCFWKSFYAILLSL